MTKNKTHSRRVGVGTTIQKLFVSLLAGTAAILSSSSVQAQTTPGPQPSICNRACWAARNGTCSTTMSLNRAIIHHTAGSEYNTSGLSASKSYVRAIQNMDMDVDGWCDIGYHFMVDKYGNIFECRKNSISGYPRGAHDSDNNNSFGFTFMGYFHAPNNNAPTTAMMNSMYALIAWKMPGGWSPYGSGTYHGNTVGKIDGHRKVVSTACPGDKIHPVYITSNYNGGAMRSGVAARRGGAPAAKDHVDLFVRGGSDNAIYKTSWATGGSWSGWENLGGSGFTSAPDSVSRVSGVVDVFARGSDGKLKGNFWIEGGSGWSGWGDHGGSLTGDPTAVSRIAESLDVFCRGTDGTLWKKNWGEGVWSAWSSLGGQIKDNPDAVSRVSSRVDIYARGTNDHLITIGWVEGTGWSAWGDLGDVITSGPGVVSKDSNSIDVFYRGSDGALWKRSWGNGVWNTPESLGGSISGGPDACSHSSNTVDVFVRWTDMSIKKKTWTSGQGWTDWINMGSPSGATSDPSCDGW